MAVDSEARLESSRGTSTGVRNGVVAVLSVTVGVCLLSLAAPRTVAAWNAIEGFEVYEGLALGRSPSNERLDAALAGLNVALDRVPSGDRFYMRASAELERYRRLPLTDATRSVWLDRAGRDLEAGLAANPVDGRASLLLAMVRAWQGASAREVVVALLHSMDTMPSMRLLWLTRATVFFAAWGALAPDEAAAVRSQLRAIWQNAPNLRIPLTEAALAAGRAGELSTALVDEPGGLAELDQLKASIASKR